MSVEAAANPGDPPVQMSPQVRGQLGVDVVVIQPPHDVLTQVLGGTHGCHVLYLKVSRDDNY